MTRRIDLMDSTARQLDRLQALTGQSVDILLESAIEARLVEAEAQAVREAILQGAREADDDVFAEQSVEDIFFEGMSRARQSRPGV